MILPYFKFGHQTMCAYCGDLGSSKDHVFPISSQTIEKRGASKVSDPRYGPTCYCCHDCNSYLNNRVFDSFMDRCESAHFRLEKKIKPIVWTEQQLSELDYGLQNMVRKDINRRLHMVHRADFFMSRDFLLNLESLIWECGRLNPDFDEHKVVLRYFRTTLMELEKIYNPQH